MLEYKRTNGKNNDFIENCRRLDADLDQRVGKEIQRSKYEKYNQLDRINEAIVVYEKFWYSLDRHLPKQEVWNVWRLI